MKKNYKKTLIACYMAFITQAIVASVGIMWPGTISITSQCI